MIHHISVSAQNPQHVAQVIAEIIKGQAVPFPGYQNSYMVVAMDEHGTAIAVLPAGVEIRPGFDRDECSFMQNLDASKFTATHAAVSVPTSQTEIEQIGKREGWRVVRCNHLSLFDVLEFWVENHLLIEFLTPEMTAQYLAASQQPDLLEQLLSQPAEAIA
jgi:hypothetical protein